MSSLVFVIITSFFPRIVGQEENIFYLVPYTFDKTAEEFTVTAYSPCDDGVGKITFSGLRVINGRTAAVDPRVVPLGSQILVYVRGMDKKVVYGWTLACDTGGKIKGNCIDLYMSDCNKAKRFGRIKAYLVKKSSYSQ